MSCVYKSLSVKLYIPVGIVGYNGGNLHNYRLYIHRFSVLTLLSDYVIMLMYSWYMLISLCHHDGCWCPGASPAPGHLQPSWWFHCNCSYMNHIMQHACPATTIKQTMFRGDLEVGNPLVSLFLEGSSSHGINASCCNQDGIMTFIWLMISSVYWHISFEIIGWISYYFVYYSKGCHYSSFS